MKTLLSRAALAAAAMALGLSGAHATTYTYSATGDLSVSLQITSTCVVGASTLSFGAIGGDPSGTPSAGSLTVKCTAGTHYDIDLGKGTGGISANRVMKGSKGGTVAYNLYYDPANTQVWGSATTNGKSWAGWAGTDRVGTGGGELINVYGLIAANQNGVPDTYSDTVIITINY